MEITKEIFKEMLVPPGHLTEEQFRHATEEAERKGLFFQEELLEEGLISDKDLGRTIADYFDHHFVDLQGVDIKDEYLTYFPEIVAHAQRAVVCDVSDDVLSLATEQIHNYEFFRLLEKKTGKKISVRYATPHGLDTALRFYKGDKAGKNDTIKKIPVIVASNLGQHSDIEEAKKLGAVDFIIKSNISLKELAEKVKEYLP